MEKEITKNRICLFDNIKFFLILTVVIGHIIDLATNNSDVYRSIFLFIYSFHMPLFIFLSGLFNRNSNPRKKVITFIFLGFAIKFLLSIAKMIIEGKAAFNLRSDGGLPWFMFAMGGYYLISYIFRDFDKRIILIMSVFLACFVGYDSSIGDYLYISRIVVFYPFFVLGEMITPERVLKLNSKKSLKVISVFVLIAWAVICFVCLDDVYKLRVLFTGRNSFSSNDAFEEWGMMYRFLCYVITAVVSFCIVCLAPSRKLPLISNYGAKTIQVYFWHWPFIMLLNKLSVLDVLFESPEGKFFAIVIGVIMTLILCLKPFGFPSEPILNSGKRSFQK